MGLRETPRRFVLKCCRYSSLQKFEDGFGTALGLILNASKAVGCSIFGRFSNLDKCRPEAACDVISGRALEYVGTDVRAGLGDIKSKVVELLSGRTRFAHLCAAFITVCSRPEAASDVISGTSVGPIVLDKL